MWGWPGGCTCSGSAVSPAFPSVQSGPGGHGWEGCTSPGPLRGSLLPAQIPPAPDSESHESLLRITAPSGPALSVSLSLPLGRGGLQLGTCLVTLGQLVTARDGLFVSHREKEPPASSRQGACSGAEGGEGMGACVCLLLRYRASPCFTLHPSPPLAPRLSHSPDLPHPLGASRPAASVSPPAHQLSSYNVLLIASSLFFSMFYIYTIKGFLYGRFCGS